MKLLFASQMQEVDRLCAGEHAVSTLSLMKQAGEKTAAFAGAKMKELKLGPALAVCGKGNNGGDGLAAVLYLKRMGLEARALLLSPPEDFKGDPAAVLQTAQAENVPMKVLDGPAELEAVLKDAGGRALIIDAVFGTGFRPPAREPWASAIEAISGSGLNVLSLDLPSGIGSDSGSISGPSVKASWTITLGAPKPALFIYPSAGRAGEVALADIGHPRVLIEDERHRMSLLEAGWCRETIGPREPDSHKGTYGHLLVAAGSMLMPGAALLTALGAVRSGTGLVTLAAVPDVSRMVVTAIPEILPYPVGEGDDGSFSGAAADDILSLAKGRKAVVIGPGVSRSEGVLATVKRLLMECPLPTVIDADALNAVADDPKRLAERRHPTVITPHPGELARLLGTTAGEVQDDRLGAALAAADRFGAVTVLKGAGTIVAEPGGSFSVNTSGNPGMASGGMGDVLAGMIGGYLAQGFDPVSSASLGVYLHGLAGDLAEEEIGPAGFTAREVADRVPAALDIVWRGHEDIEEL